MEQTIGCGSALISKAANQSRLLLENYPDAEYCVIACAAAAKIRIEIAVASLKNRVVVGTQPNGRTLRPSNIYAAAKLHREVRLTASHTR